MHLFQIHHSLKMSRYIHSSFWLFELSIWLQVFARALIAVFIPIILLRVGYSVGEVMIYYFIYNAIDFPLNFFGRWLTRKIGARIVMIIGVVFMLAYFLSLSFLIPNSWWFLIMLAFFSAMYDALYWVAHLFYFVECSEHKENISKDTSTLYIVKRIAALVAPAIGAGILILINQNALIYVSAFFVILSVIPLFKIHKVNDKPSEPQKTFKEFFNSWNISKDYFSVMFFGIHIAVEDVIFPIFIYILFSSIESVAAIPIIVSLGAIIFTYFAGKIKKENRGKSMAIGAILIAIVWLLRLMVADNIFYYASIFLVGLFSVMISVPLVSNVFEKGELIDGLSSSTYRNAASMFAKMILYGFLALLVYVFNVSFIVAGLGLFILMLVNIFIKSDKDKVLQKTSI